MCKRPASGLLAGLWQFPDVPGALDLKDALSQAEAWGIKPRNVEKVVRRQHIFTHVQWELTGCYLECGAEACFTWVTPSELKERIGLPTAYRQFLEE